MKSYPIATNTIPAKTERQQIEVTRDELDALLDAGLVYVIIEFDGKVPGTSRVSREQIMRFLLERPDQVAKNQAEEQSTR